MENEYTVTRIIDWGYNIDIYFREKEKGWGRDYILTLPSSARDQWYVGACFVMKLTIQIPQEV